MTKTSLIADVDAARAEQAAHEKQRHTDERDRARERVRAAINYTLGQEPDSVHWEPFIGAVAVIDGIVMTLKHHSGVPNLSVVCTCKQCGQKFVSQETFGSDKNHYGPKAESPPKQRRENAVAQIAKVAARNYQPNGYGHDHKCVAYVTREIPVQLIDQVDAILNEDG